MNRTNNTFWQGLAEFAKSIPACVNVTYNGAEGSIHIDIVPINKTEAVASKIIEQGCPTELLPEETEETQKNTEDKALNVLEGEPDSVVE